MLLPRLEFSRPATLDEACRELADLGDDAAVVAGGTDLLVRMKRGDRKPARVISIALLRSDAPVTRLEGGGLAVDPLATMSELARSSGLGGPFAGLAEGAAAVGSPLVRNRASVGGNLVSARPCADTAPPLLTLNATARLQSASVERAVALDDFFLGPGETRIRPDEILCAIEIPAPAGPSGSAFFKLIRRATLEITITSAAASITLDRPGGVVTEARIVLGSVAPIPLRAHAAEKHLIGGRADRHTLARAASEAASEAKPIDDLRGSASYRREMVRVLVVRALEQALARAGGAP